MVRVTIYHNPRCTKSRETLKLLEARDVEPVVVEYLVDPPDVKTLKTLAGKLGLRPRDFIRRKEKEFRALKLKDKLDNDDALLKAMAAHPILIERPIVVAGRKAALGRPPQAVLEIL